MHIKPEWIQAGLDEFYSVDGSMTSAIEKIAPLIRSAALEDAAGVARWASTGETAAANILAMRETDHAHRT